MPKIKLIPVVIAVVFIAALAGYVMWQKRANIISDQPIASQNPVRSSAYIYGPELNKVKVILYAPDETKSTLPASYCGGSAGSAVYQGNYKLRLDSSTAISDNPGSVSDLAWKDSVLSIGQFQFIKGEPWDGSLMVDQLDPTGYKNFILLKQYGSCNGYNLYIYGYDFEMGKLMQYKFADLISPRDTIYVTEMKKSKGGNLVTSAYNNATGKTITMEWAFDSSSKTFMSISTNN